MVKTITEFMMGSRLVSFGFLTDFHSCVFGVSIDSNRTYVDTLITIYIGLFRFYINIIGR